jgi:hypothetical protein
MKKILYPTQSQVPAIFGNPTGSDGNSSPVWEAKNLVYIRPPFKMAMGDIPITRIRIHKLVADSLLEVLNEIWDKCSKDQNIINLHHYNIFSGSFNYRSKRGKSSLSMHAYGVAIDFDAPHNGMGDITPGFLPDSIIVKAFEEHGWTWGGRWSGRSIDGMHFQYPRVD